MMADALASIRADPTAQVPQETTTDAKGASTSEYSGVLNPLWHGTWAIQNPDSPYGLQRIEIDASGFNFHLQAHQSDVSTLFVPWREAGDKRQMPDGYMTYTDERVTRDDLVSRYETALRTHPRQSVTPPDAARRVLGALRPGRYKVVARLMRYDDACGDRYVLDDDVLVEFSECEGFWLKQLARQ